MAEQELNGAHVGAGFQQMDSESPDVWRCPGSKWSTSSGLRTTGSFCGFFGAGMTSSKFHFFLRETL